MTRIKLIVVLSAILVFSVVFTCQIPLGLDTIGGSQTSPATVNGIPTPAGGGVYQTVRLTYNDFDDYFPQIYGGLVTWQGHDGYDDEIFLFDGANIHKLSDNNNLNDWSPQIHDGMVTWYGFDSQDYEIFLFDGEITERLTQNNFNDVSPQIHDGMVTWQGHDGRDYEIFLFDGEITQQLTQNYYYDGSPQIHDGMVTWHGSDGHDYEIFFFNGTITQQLTDNNFDDTSPQIHDGMVTWYGSDGHDNEIFLFDGEITQQLTDNDVFDGNPKVHDGMVTWQGYVGYDNEIFLFDGEIIHQLTDNYFHDRFQQIHDGLVTWQGYDGRDDEIFLFDGEIIHKLSDNDYNDVSPQIHDGMVTWHGFAVETGEIFLSSRIDFEWVIAPVDQFLLFGEPLVCQMAVTSGVSEVVDWWINDTRFFELNAVNYRGGGTALVTNTTTLAPGDYGLWVVVTNSFGRTLDAIFSVTVIEIGVPPRLELTVTGSFEYEKKNKLEIRLTAMLTEESSGAPVTGATVTFTIYEPDGTGFLFGYLIEDSDPGVYVYSLPDEFKDFKEDLPEGIYLVYAEARALDGRETFDVIWFQVDSPEHSDVSMIITIGVGIPVIAIIGFVVVYVLQYKWRAWKRRF